MIHDPIPRNSAHCEQIAAAIRYLQDHYEEQPSLAKVAETAGMSPHHFQRVFKRWCGVSPKRLLQHLTIESAKGWLRESASVLQTTLEVGLSSTARLHDLFLAVESVTPGEFKNQGEGVEICYGVHPTPFGHCLIGLTHRGICWLSFLEESKPSPVEWSEFESLWSAATRTEDLDSTRTMVQRIFPETESNGTADTLNLHLTGTNFELQVWQALLAIPEGQVASYHTVAQMIKHPSNRAVASAIGRNHIGYLIPCHRILRKHGEWGEYRWGPRRKRLLLAYEHARTNPGISESA